MTKVTEKVVLSLDREAQSYIPAGHNLSAEQEAGLTGRLRSEGRVFVSFDQETHHRSLSFCTCKICRNYAEQATREHREALARDQTEDQSAQLSEKSEAD